ncbi:MFS transporter [Rhodococcus sp. BP-349]|uniref:MFS transporter n=1 Tax=unclassified Rhodococcus (in: high G+C Gram-positive bacteria) TaxID=192944 RepID=UPI001C9BA111|nr:MULTISPECIES: MFS transporter [unclassified Rhodococcus (in: high G+C Gram-positive bacteria)]MBY6540341.1 MFS transporter [Rhodococcus sp. BP-363]MBY6545634.1 MFS transporter [Rhodococcus sp. BP-369]MBY6564864.1 MFS transporter [Rhodococcus sp. BP-370]MBY6578200.1 MFS transporter [Rhodococcus sp. BP-364]MBY6587501.1 MFS transporter [Rhodococcus sp. BP-358]
MPGPMGRALVFLLPLGVFGLFVLQGGVVSVLLGRQVAEQYSERESVGVLGAVLAVAALAGLISQPVWGRLSDRGSGRWLGRRNTWVLGGALAAIPLMSALAVAENVVVITVLFALSTSATSAVAVAVSTALPERVPIARRGSMSGALAVCQMVGLIAGVALAGAGGIVFGYFAVLVVFVATSSAFAFLARDPSRTTESVDVVRQPSESGRRFPPWGEARDFYMAAAGRFLILFGASSALGFLLYMLRDYVRVGDGSIEAATEALVPLTAVNGVFTLISAAIGGYLADRFARLKIFVVISSLLLVPSAVILFFVPTMTGMYVAAAVLGLGLGTYLSVDQALVAMVLPSKGGAGNDLGLINIANTLPSVLAPAVAGGLVTLTGSFRPVFVVMAISVTLGALTVRYISDAVR